MGRSPWAGIHLRTTRLSASLRFQQRAPDPKAKWQRGNVDTMATQKVSRLQIDSLPRVPLLPLNPLGVCRQKAATAWENSFIAVSSLDDTEQDQAHAKAMFSAVAVPRRPRPRNGDTADVTKQRSAPQDSRTGCAQGNETEICSLLK